MAQNAFEGNRKTEEQTDSVSAGNISPQTSRAKDYGTWRTTPRAPGSSAATVSALNNRNLIRLQNFSSGNRSGLFGNAPAEMTVDQFKTYIANLSYEERRRLKSVLYNAGYYARVEYQTGGDARTLGNLDVEQPESGSWFEADDQALGAMLSEYYVHLDTNKDNMDLDTFVQQRVIETSKMTGLALEGTGVDPLGLADELQAWATKGLGRELSEQELTQIMQYVFTSNRPDERSGLVQYNNIGQRIITGGGPTSSAIGFGTQLANAYNLVVSQSFASDPTQAGIPADLANAYKDGRAVTLTGDSAQLMRFLSWAQTQDGEKSFIETVRGEDSETPDGRQITKVRVVFRDEAKIPEYMQDVNFAGQQLTNKQQFVESLRSGNSVDGFNWGAGSDPMHRGAYGLSDQLWSYWTGQLGIDSSDYSIENQNRVIEAHTDFLYQKYNGNWELMALAMVADEGTADAVAYNMSLAGNQGTDPYGSDPSVIKARKIVADMPKRVRPQNESGGAASLNMTVPTLGWRASQYGGIPEDNDQAKAKAMRVFKDVYKSDIDTYGVISALEEEIAKSQEFDPYADWRK